jgi:hypothetical protein
MCWFQEDGKSLQVQQLGRGQWVAGEEELNAQADLNQSETVCVTLKRFRVEMRQEWSEAEI